jgi:hypothetical protein
MIFEATPDQHGGSRLPALCGLAVLTGRSGGDCAVRPTGWGALWPASPVAGQLSMQFGDLSIPARVAVLVGSGL